VEAVPQGLEATLKHIGIITCGFHFLNNPQHNPHLHSAHKELEKLPTVSEKAIKGDALSHQAM
jgi:hypothetical protein